MVESMTTHEVILPLFQQAPQKRYSTLVADPPWRYDVKPPEGGTSYPTMTQEELLNLPVGLWAADNAHLYLWTTNSFLPEAFALMKAWGFEYKTLLTWIKRKPQGDKWIGLGFYYRGVTEHVLFGVRGSMGVMNKDQANFFFGARGGHSEKPSVFYDIVERMSGGPYLDVFSRKQRFNWDTWGNEAFDFQTAGIWHKEQL